MENPKVYIEVQSVIAIQWDGVDIEGLKKFTKYNSCAVNEDTSVLVEFENYALKAEWEDMIYTTGDNLFQSMNASKFKKKYQPAQPVEQEKPATK